MSSPNCHAPVMTRVGGTTSVRPMLGSHPLASPLSGVLTRLRDWPVAAQQQARRNAMVAATACAQRRIEREEVADFLRSRTQLVDDTTAEPRIAPLASRTHG